MAALPSTKKGSGDYSDTSHPPTCQTPDGWAWLQYPNSRTPQVVPFASPPLREKERVRSYSLCTQSITGNVGNGDELPCSTLRHRKVKPKGYRQSCQI